VLWTRLRLVDPRTVFFVNYLFHRKVIDCRQMLMGLVDVTPWSP
jgi:hypothetical protein